MGKIQKTLLLASLLCSCAFSQAYAQNVTQPIGTLVRVWETTGTPPFALQPPSRIPPFTAPTTPIGEVNYITAQWDTNITPQTVPFDINDSATEIILTQPQHFVRVYAPASGSGPNGVWIVRSEYVRGLTPQQIKDRFALPSLPTHIVNVDLPGSPDPNSGKDIALWTGIAGPIAGFGNGGGVQNRIIADFNGTHYFPNYTFIVGRRDHPQSIGQFALSYQRFAETGNEGSVAAYLDKFIPTAYSDLEFVYTDLDYLNWEGFGPDPIRHALEQISPEKYAAVPFVVTRNALLFKNAIFAQNPRIKACCNAKGCDANSTDDCDEPECSESYFSLDAVGEFINDDKLGPHTSFTADSGGLVGTFVYPVCEGLTGGVSAAGLSTDIHYRHHGGRATVKTAKLGLYVDYSPSWAFLPNVFLDTLFTAGYNWTKANRNIRFPIIDRRAHSSQKGWDFDAHFRAGFCMPAGNWSITPLLTISYFYVHQNGFKEHDADSLNLRVRNISLQTLRTNLGFAASNIFNLCGTCVTSQFDLAWAHDTILGNRSIHAGLIDLDGHFSVKSFYSLRDSAIVGFMLGTELRNDWALNVRYDAEFASHFTSQSVYLSVEGDF